MTGAADHAVLVFGATVTAGGEPGPTLRQRLRAALELARADPAAVVIVSGGVVRRRPPEATVMARWLTSHGLQPERVVTEDRSRSTWDNAALAAPLIARLGAGRVSVVTQRYHAPRALRLLREALGRVGRGDATVVLVPADDPRSGRLAAASKHALEKIKLLNDSTLRRLRHRVASIRRGRPR